VLPITANATDDKWCGLMVSIYGLCSPQLIDNYLLMTANPPKPPTTIHASVNSTFPAVVILEAVKINKTAKKEQSWPVVPGYRYTFYWNGITWVHGRLIN
jgi:hypothetical protein